MVRKRYIILAVAAASWTSLAAAQKEKAPGMPTVTETSTPSTASSTAILSDANIVALLNEANMADSSTGAMVLPKATRTDVKDFAKLMMGEHHTLHVETEQVAKAQKITPTMPANDPFKSAVTNEQQALTSAAKSHAFDSTYIAQEIGIHKAVIAWAGKAEMWAQNSALESLIKKAAPVLNHHLERAEAIEKVMNARTTASR